MNNDKISIIFVCTSIMESKYFRINKKEYCHITDKEIFIVNTKNPTRIPLELELGEGWGIKSVLNYIWFVLLFVFLGSSITYYGVAFFKEPINYGAIALLVFSYIRIKNGFVTSRTPTIKREAITNTVFKAPKFSYPRLIVKFKGPEGKILKRIIPILYKQEALPILQEEKLITSP